MVACLHLFSTRSEENVDRVVESEILTNGRKATDVESTGFRGSGDLYCSLVVGYPARPVYDFPNKLVRIAKYRVHCGM